MATAKKIRDLNPVGRKPYGVYNRYGEYFNLLLNAVAIFKADGARLDFPQERFAKTALFEMGAVGYDKITGKFYYAYGEGRNELGDPTTLTLVTANGLSFARPASYDENPDGAYIIRALPFGGITMGGLIKETCDFMTNCDVAMRQNLEACKSPYVIVCKNEDLRLSFEQASDAKMRGQAVLVVSEDLGEGLKAINISADFLVDKFAMARDRERDDLLTKLGILTSNDDKKERVQSAEVNATLGQATDYIYLLIDTFNKQAEAFGLPFEMRYNGSMEEIYLDDDESADTAPVETDVNDVERTN